MRSDPVDVTEVTIVPSPPAVLAEPARPGDFDLPLFSALVRASEPILLPPPEKRPAPDALDAIRQKIAARTGHDAAVVERITRAFLEATADALAETGSVDVRPLGSFRTVERRERTGRHPRTGEPIRIPPKRGVAFRVGKRLRDRVDVPAEIARLLERERAETARREARIRALDPVALPAAAKPPASPPFPAPAPAPRVRLGKIVGIASGKGGTGKTFLAANLAVALALSGVGVAAVDADLGLANLHLLLGVQPAVTLGQVVFENASLESAIHRTPGGVDLVTGGAGASALADLKPAQLERLAEKVRSLRAGRDIVLVDSAAGLSPRTLRLMHDADLCLVATTPEVTAMTDAYAVLKTLARTPERRARIALVVNQARSEAEGARVHEKLKAVAEKFLDVPALELWAIVPEDPEVGRSVARRRPLTLDPAFASPAADAVRALAARIRRWADEGRPI